MGDIVKNLNNYKKVRDINLTRQDLIEFEDSSAVRAWISTNSLTIITRDQAQAIYDAAVASSQDTGLPHGNEEPSGYSSDKPAHPDLRAKAMTLP